MVNFVGEYIDILIEVLDTTLLTYDETLVPEIVLIITRELSNSYIYIPISSDHLFTLETAPTI